MPELKSFDRVAHCYDETRAMPPDVTAQAINAIAAALREVSAATWLLEIGVGTGRIAVPVAKAGVHVIGVDDSEGMLGLCRMRAEEAGVSDLVELRLGDLRRPPVRETVRLVTCPFRALLHLRSDEERLDALRAVYRLLVPGGQIGTRRFVRTGAPTFREGQEAVLFLRQDEAGSASRYHLSLTDGGGAGGTRTPDPLHAMQVLSQLSYNPTVGPLVGALSGAIRPALTGCSTGEFRVSAAAGFHHPGSLEARHTRTAPASRRSSGEYRRGLSTPQRPISCRECIAGADHRS